ncbi:MAG: 16S rRNA (guanine(966)-N(2))-methyltransferase RsmD [Clostridia bacterium]|jgi:16S rRNA (guanine966-N2)-methyltransferase|nr:16S rRNA (guanine(966)-N(2))-methyltransferase RsmD [Clostridia bacterium]
MRIISGRARGTKLYTLEGTETRPTLDRVKESIFNIIQGEIENSDILDLFAGSGAIGIEMLSRGASKAVLCDKSKQAIEIIKKNIEKTHMEKYVELYNLDFEKMLDKLNGNEFDIIYLDPPYNTNYIKKSLNKIIETNLIKREGTIIVETDDELRILEDIKNIKIEIIDKRKYGRATIIFLKRQA